MIDFAQSNLVSLIAGAVVASSLLVVASWERALRDDLEFESALDGLAFSIGSAACSALHPLTRVGLSPTLEKLRQGQASTALLPDHLRALVPGGRSLSSVRFPPLLLDTPLELDGASVLEITYDPVEERCTANAR